MNKRYAIIAAALLLAAQTATAQPHTPQQTGGIYYAYPAVKAVYTAAPAGYEPFYISHYGRHGSRWLPNDERYEWVNAQFADDSNLTPLGRSVKARLQKIWANAQGNGGKLTPLGAKQHAGIAERMYKHYPQVFGGQAKILARASTKDRCIKSMNSFCARLRQKNKQLQIKEQTGEQYMSYIALNTPEIQELEARTKPQFRSSPDRLMQSLFVHPQRIEQPFKLMSELHTIASDMQDVPLKIDLFDIFTAEEMQAVEDYNDERMRIVNGEDPTNMDIPEQCAASLWRNIVESADAAIAGKGENATLRFGHDTCLYRLLTLLGISVGEDMFSILPMAANLQLIFYRSAASGDVLVKFLHNEKEVALPIEAAEGCYYRWDDVKKHYDRWLQMEKRRRIVAAVNTLVGTDAAVTTTAGLFGKGSEEHGQTLPAVLEPNGMNFWTPQTRATERKCIAPYYYPDSLFMGFRNSHWIVGGCTQDYGSFTVSAMSGALRTASDLIATPFSHEQEVSHPDYYSVFLPQEQLQAELTGRSHSAIMRFTSRQKQRIYIVIAPNSDEQMGTIAIDRQQKCIFGSNPVHRIYQGWGEAAGFSGHFFVMFQKEMADCGVRDGVAFVAFDMQAGEQLLLKAGSSFCGVDKARSNLLAEIPHWDFLRTRLQLNEIWQKRFALIDVEGADVEKFYGALYRASFLPREFSDVDGRYPSFAGGQRTMRTAKDAVYYNDFSMWDTYRAMHPLINIITPKKGGDMMQSLVSMYEQGGWLPIFPCWNSYTAAMIGDHCIAALSDAYVKGIRNFNFQKAYEGMRQNAFDAPGSREDYLNGMGRRALQSYLAYGYIPLEDSVKEAFHQNEQVSRTLEYAYDDFALAQMAKALGKDDDFQLLTKRAQNYRNVIDPRTGYAQGRHADGSFLNAANQAERISFITEGAPCHYTWYVPHDPAGLMQAMGGREAFVLRLDSLFSEHRYWHGNEPCHQVAYMYGYAGQPWKTQREVRRTLNTEYLDTPGGLSGNDDAGQMSAWYIFSALGFYPVCPATTEYVIGSPTFTRASIQLENGRTFTIETENAAPENIYIQRATLDGKPYNRCTFTHDDILQGSVLRFVMGPDPNPSWGVGR